MSTVRDYSMMPAVKTAVENARNAIIACWEEWESQAGEHAQIEQNSDAWFASMHAQLDCVLYGILDQLPDGTI